MSSPPHRPPTLWAGQRKALSSPYGSQRSGEEEHRAEQFNGQQPSPGPPGVRHDHHGVPGTPAITTALARILPVTLVDPAPGR
ncbi:hypothetical protein SK803_27830 [Lentzea sp. BCCO 10_0856]|uniref:Uncharacterized protein n=1 Tax=Lentzea miocenica TaxID=3095431 RepID=A0ABU4T7H1_9PSEU|nr:hypothetical protein [Lentzea sp. BCCO 10_0856]MDX8034045.1 hypothetical protein [Lentzea sp. BCCO 10_0856]